MLTVKDEVENDHISANIVIINGEVIKLTIVYYYFIYDKWLADNRVTKPKRITS